MDINYIFPPRAENAISYESIAKFDNGTLFAQPKLNGSCGVLFVDKLDYTLMSRHKEILTNVKLNKEDFLSLHRGTDRTVLVGEYLNKNKKHIDNKDFNHKFVIFDILTYNGIYLLGTSFKARQDILNNLYRNESKYFDGYIRSIDDNMYIVENFNTGFSDLYKELIKIDLYEGIVMKMFNALLESGRSKSNNTKSMIKCRKSTKNYVF